MTWDDLDLDNGTAIISQQVTVVEREVRIKVLPKTKRAHLIRLDSFTVAMVLAWRARQNEERLSSGRATRTSASRSAIPLCVRTSVRAEPLQP